MEMEEEEEEPRWISNVKMKYFGLPRTVVSTQHSYTLLMLQVVELHYPRSRCFSLDGLRVKVEGGYVAHQVQEPEVSEVRHGL
eukprot:1180400-Prorocentrum_minimum.AAC.1